MSLKRSRPFARHRLTIMSLMVAFVALLVPATAGAATVVNGDFETGNLSGWNTSIVGGGGWFAYSGTKAPLSEEFEPRTVQPPPQGNFAAISDETGPGLHILYQDIAIEPAISQTLSMLVYYDSYDVLASPDTLSPSGAPNQQYRIDVMKPSAPIESVNPADILTTVFRTNTGDPESMTPKMVTANLTPFAGQTVRLRLAEVDNEFFFNAGADAISIATVPLPPPPSNAFTFGKLTLNKKKGTGTLQVNVPGPGTLSLVDANSSTVTPSDVASTSKKKKKKATIKSATALAAAAGQVSLKLKATGVGNKTLNKKRKLKFKVLVTFTPTGGTAASQTFSGTLRKKPKPKHR